MAQFEALVRTEADGFWTIRWAVLLLQRALEEEQAGARRMMALGEGGGGGREGLKHVARKKTCTSFLFVLVVLGPF